MNTTGVQVQMPLQGKTIAREKIPSELSGVFKNLLSNIKLPVATEAKLVETKVPIEQKNHEDPLQGLLDSLPEELKAKLVTLLNDKTEIKEIHQAIEGMNLPEKLLEQLKELLQPIKINTKLSPVQSDVDMATIILNVNPTTTQPSQKEIILQLEEVSKKAELLLSGIADSKSTKKLAAEIQKLLERWTSLDKKLSGSNELKTQIGSQATSNASKAQNVWHELINTYQKRNQLVTSQQYNSSAKVTSGDVAKWIDNALTKTTGADSSIVTQANLTSMPATKVEQYVIHLNQSQTNQSKGQQLVEKFQKVVQSSKFLTMNNGSTQLSLSLRPANLGEMMVKLTQINGEMTVKIIVASAAARDMLESNMQQLKHMFSPQQVVIEKQDIHTNQTQSMQQNKDQQAMNKENQSQSEQSESDEQKQSNDDFEKQFHEILMNEKV
ncbi:flagellar hook-length control protein FliK [Virgibacillus sp. DJP39]|uniref:flagellar hook-length control protein FliK n=1 Tax=Virgibacillus sp. DJP39 TaxID=3409790 RepID=UPI003BB5B3EE